MATSVYVAAVEGFTGKSTVALGVLEQLSRRVERVAVYRPVVRGDAATDYVLDLLVSHDAVQLTYDECAGVTYADVHRDPEGALDRIVDRFHQVAAKVDAVVVVGSDYTDVGAPTEFSFNARLAANLGSPVLLVLNAHDRTLDGISTAADLAVSELNANHGTLFAIVANRVDGDLEAVVKALDGHGVPAFALPEEPLLSAPSVADLMAACDGTLVSGEESLLSQESTGIVVAAMTLPHVLDRLFEGAVVVTPGDRPEVVLGVLTAQVSANFPQMAGIVLNGGFELPEQVTRLIDGLGTTMPIVATDLDTSDTTQALTSVRGRLHKDSPRKVATALALFDERVDRDVLLDRLEVARTRGGDAADVRAPAHRPGRRRPAPHRAARGGRRPDPPGRRHGAAPPHRRPDDPRRARARSSSRGRVLGVDISAATAAEPDRPGAARAVRRGVPRTPQAQGHRPRAGPRHRHRRLVLRHA